MKIDIDKPAVNGNNALLYAISKNDLEAVKVLAELGADLNYWNQQSDGATALHMSVLLGMFFHFYSPLIHFVMYYFGLDSSSILTSKYCNLQ